MAPSLLIIFFFSTPYISHCLFSCIGLGGRCNDLIWTQTTDADVVDDFFDLLDIVLQGIVALAEAIIFQIQQTETGIQIGDETGYIQWSLVITQCNGVDGKAGLELSEKLRCVKIFMFKVMLCPSNKLTNSEAN